MGKTILAELAFPFFGMLQDSIETPIELCY